MRPIFFCLTFVCSTILASGPHSDYIEKYPMLASYQGNAKEGEIEIILDKQKILEIEKQTGRKVGIIGEDKYWLWINDAVKFPAGTYGVYGRVLWRQSLTGVAGVAVLPLLSNGKIALNRNFRHATRSWEYELPRGALNMGEKPEQAALREVKEETGMVIDELQWLGDIAPDSGLTNSVIPVFLAKTIEQETAEPDDSEAIASIDAFSVEELKQGFIDGYLSITINGEVQKIPLRDPFLAFALFQAEIRGLLP